MERAASLADGFELDRADFVPASQKSPPMTLPGGRAEELVDEGVPFKEAKQRITDAFEASYLKALLDKYGEDAVDAAMDDIDWMIDDDGSRWIVIDTEYLRQHVAHYALLSADTWRQRLLDAGVEVD